MKVYDDKDAVDETDMKWVKVDRYYPELPAWSCYCIVKSNHVFDFEVEVNEFNSYVAYAQCPSCLGYGIMPIPPSELR